MTDIAAQLVDRVFPSDAAVRPWVLTVPFELRLLPARDPDVLSQVLRVFHDEVERGYLERAVTELVGERRSAVVTMVQRFSGHKSLASEASMCIITRPGSTVCSCCRPVMRRRRLCPQRRPRERR